MHDFDVAVIGAGASGALVAIHYHRTARPGSRLALIEAGARAARGLAYGTPYGAHLLNVAAARMTALPDDPDHFVRWLQARIPGAHGGTFAPRPLYGDYLHDLLDDATSIERIGGTAVGLTRELAGDPSQSTDNGQRTTDPHAPPWTIHLHDGRQLRARAVVLALGNLPPGDPLQLRNSPAEYLRDPWAPGAAVGLAPDAPVLLIGTGLTMMDVALALRAQGHRGALHALSRNGRLPRAHATFEPRPLASVPHASPSRLLRFIREQIAVAGEWRAVVDSLRPHTAAIWRSWTPAQRATFLRHARNLWDVHRHRAAPEVASQFEALMADGTLQIHRGRVVRIEPGRVVWRPSGSDATETLEVARVINCTGPRTDYAKLDLPLVDQLRRAGWLTPDPLALGVETADDGRLLDRDGRPVDGLFTLGPLRRPALWESTAIPEIRAQAVALAQQLS